MSDTLIGAGMGLANLLGFGAIIPDPISKLKDELESSRDELQALINQSSVVALNKVASVTEIEYSALQRYTDAQISTQSVMNEFIKQDIQIQGLSLFFLSMIVSIIFVFGFVLK